MDCAIVVPLVYSAPYDPTLTVATSAVTALAVSATARAFARAFTNAGTGAKSKPD